MVFFPNRSHRGSGPDAGALSIFSRPMPCFIMSFTYPKLFPGGARRPFASAPPTATRGSLPSASLFWAAVPAGAARVAHRRALAGLRARPQSDRTRVGQRQGARTGQPLLGQPRRGRAGGPHGPPARSTGAHAGVRVSPPCWPLRDAQPGPDRAAEIAGVGDERRDVGTVFALRAHGFSTGLWTLPRVARVIKRVTGVKYHPGHVWRLLGALNVRPNARRNETSPPSGTG